MNNRIFGSLVTIALTIASSLVLSAQTTQYKWVVVSDKTEITSDDVYVLVCPGEMKVMGCEKKRVREGVDVISRDAVDVVLETDGSILDANLPAGVSLLQIRTIESQYRRQFLTPADSSNYILGPQYEYDQFNGKEYYYHNSMALRKQSVPTPIYELCFLKRGDNLDMRLACRPVYRQNGIKYEFDSNDLSVMDDASDGFYISMSTNLNAFVFADQSVLGSTKAPTFATDPDAESVNNGIQHRTALYRRVVDTMTKLDLIEQDCLKGDMHSPRYFDIHGRFIAEGSGAQLPKGIIIEQSGSQSRIFIK